MKGQKVLSAGQKRPAVKRGVPIGTTNSQKSFADRQSVMDGCYKTSVRSYEYPRHMKSDKKRKIKKAVRKDMRKHGGVATLLI